MKTALAPFALSSFLLLAACSGGTPTPACSSTTCGGCCDSAGKCQPGGTQLACGTNGRPAQPVRRAKSAAPESAPAAESAVVLERAAAQGSVGELEPAAAQESAGALASAAALERAA